VLCEQRVRELPRGEMEVFPLTQKPSEVTLEGFYRERVSPARGGCGRRG
jgi:hypothetical protein